MGVVCFEGGIAMVLGFLFGFWWVDVSLGGRGPGADDCLLDYN